MIFNSIKKVFFILTVTILPLQLFAQEHTPIYVVIGQDTLQLLERELTPAYVVFGQDTMNRVNSLGNKEGVWLKYDPNPYTTLEMGSDGEGNHTFRSWTYFKHDSIYNTGEVTITERQFYENGKKHGVWYVYYIDEELRYKTFFHEKIKYEAFFNDDRLQKVIGYNFSGKKSMLIKRKNLTDFFVVKRKNLHTTIVTEEEVLNIFEWK